MDENSAADVHTPQWWDSYFSPGGGGEVNGGPRQTILFSRAFCEHTALDRNQPCRLLDSSCALGEAMPVFRRYFPQATLVGADVSTMAVARAALYVGAQPGDRQEDCPLRT